MKDPKPVYATISLFGTSWTVYFQKQQNDKDNTFSIKTLSGYGDFPFDKFHGINIIDYRNNEKVFNINRLNILVREATFLSKYTTTFYSIVSLKEFLKIHLALGISVIVN